ncbi:phosphoadenylyl-sulfate reductase [Sandaracinobacter neustonicus]|uniref:Adenosine 5'-phosphosulfate reductase n=1 Tax=Sandaracinobacter neustonicus TaxID=1715348 RepID=A0A501XMT3_9SPHN|nr:phosphoadenylyl-sulfate reductase [Sandaracinobacter neustonicus]TPE61769.1 phosphoadenylyl-sulfate reductase [Sandaracinobacter neustonicus]
MSLAAQIPESPLWHAADAPALSARYGADSARALADALTDPAFGDVAVVSSFGAESAVLLHMVSQIRRDVPVLFVETGWLFPETLRYAEDLSAHLRLSDVRWLHPDQATLDAKDPKRLRWSYDPDGCCEIRKVEPLDRGLQPFNLWVSGRKSHQNRARAQLSLFETQDKRLKLNPLHDWTNDKLRDYAATHQLPPHPLVADGYPSIGCSPCTSRVQPGEDPRAGRWRGWDKSECGIHKAPDADHEPVF